MKHTLEIDRDEHAEIAGQAGKKIHIFPYSFYEQNSLVSGYLFYGLCVPGANPTQSAFRILREEINSGNVLYGDGSSKFVHQWSSSSMASISWS